MSEAAELSDDNFDAEFAAAREADDGFAPQTETDESDAPASGEDDGAEAGEGSAEPIQAEAERVTKRLQDTQRALKAERLKRQEIERRIEAMERSQSGKTEAPDLSQLAEALRNDSDDPIGDLDALKKIARQLMGQTQAERAAEAQTVERQRALQTMSQTMGEYETDFRALNPDYDKAAQHFMTTRAEELRDTGLDGAALQQAMQADFAGLVQRAIASGKDPAEIVYNLAKRRGFGVDTATTKLQTIAKGQAASRTLPGGGPSGGTLPAAKVADLKGAAFDAAFEKLRAAERRR